MNSATIYRKSHRSRRDTADKYLHFRAKRELQVIEAVQKGHHDRQSIATAIGVSEEVARRVIKALVDAQVLTVSKKVISLKPLEKN